MEDQAHTLLDLLGFEGEMFSHAVEQAAAATTTTQTLSYMATAVDHAFACLEHAACLRATDPERSQQLCATWRGLAIQVSRDMDKITHGALEWGRSRASAQ